MENQHYGNLIPSNLQDNTTNSPNTQGVKKRVRTRRSKKTNNSSFENSPSSSTNNINMVVTNKDPRVKERKSPRHLFPTIPPLSAPIVRNGVLYNYYPMPSTSNGLFSTSLPSTLNVLLSPTNKNSHNSKLKETKSNSPKPKEAASFSLHAFSHKKRRSNNIWKVPLSEDVASNDQRLECVIVETFNFHYDIEAVLNPSSGFFIRKRSSCKNINLKSFGANIPVIFFSNFVLHLLDTTIEILNDKMDKLNLNKSIDLSKGEVLPDTERTNKKTSNHPKVTGAISKKKHKEDSNIKAKPSNIEVKEKKRKKIHLRMKAKTKKELVNYPEYMKEEDIQEGLKDGSLIKGIIRINQRNNRDAYVTNIIKGDTDYFIKSLEDQNRALDGDEVVLKIKRKEEWIEGRKTAVVVFISKMVHSRTSVGKLVPIRKNQNFAAFYPRDKRIPIIHIPTISWPSGFQTHPEQFAKTLFVAKITEWTNMENAKGLIIENVGMSGDLKIENLAILKTFGLDHLPFSNDLLKDLPRLDGLQESWFDEREDLRKECIFTIDPLTARDLDDAVSCKVLPDGNYEIGVHIADVSFFLKDGSALDKQVANKATTVYMIENAYHMLPVELCMTCSLLPGKDKLSFSVFWKMTPEGEILDKRFARTVMNSCTQLAYEHAQAIIDDPENFDRANFPPILNGYNVDDISDVVLKLYHISKNLRGNRFENGALRIDRMKLSFYLDPETGFPLGYYSNELKEANRLIEEFMLLANISVAGKIRDSFPEIAFLRRHEPPKEIMMKDLKKGLESVGIHVDISTAKSVQSSLIKYGSNDVPGKIRADVLSHLLAKPMTRARYFCPGVEQDAESYGHYALNIPLYTHFTSPIRRYADIMVHRLLEASLELTEKPNWTPSVVSEIAERCNIMKYNATKAQEDCTKLYLSLYIDKHGPFIRDAAVVDVKERTFDVLVLECGEVLRIYLNETEGAKFAVEEIPNPDLNPENKIEHQKKYWRIKLLFLPTKNHSASEIIIELFTLVKIELKRCPKKKKLTAKLLRPNA